MLHANQRDFGMCGTKDRRGVTTQHVTVYKQRASRLAKLRLYGMKVGAVCKHHPSLKAPWFQTFKP